MKKLYAAMAILLTILLVVPGCAPASLDCAQPDVLCVGLVTDVDRRDDRAYNQAAWEGIQQAKSDGMADWTASIETIDARDYEENISVFAEADYDVIVTVGDAMGDATRAAAKAYPDSFFIGVDQDQSTQQDFSPNLTGLVFAEDQIGYLAGALAALMSKTGQIGAVCASDELPFMKRYGEGFLAGATYINPEVKATVIYHNDVGLDKTFVDPEWGATEANSLVDSGTDFIFGVGGATGINAIVAAVTRGAYGIGADTDQYYALPVAAPHLYLSVLKLIAPGIAELIKTARDAQDGTSVFPAGNYVGQVGLAPYHDLDSSTPDEVKLRMTELNQALISGDMQTGVSITNP
ncbi:MAG: BMP family ABC transporter substrate-binding protein [Chloroflexi bacterium]|nr:BMP family ABC transporter substrate-binding protein [Chloroflexota bacterium]